MRVAYVCDGEGCRSGNKYCRWYPVGDAMRCTHTTDPRHAVNGVCDAPDMCPERFAELEPGVYWEKDCESLQTDNE